MCAPRFLACSNSSRIKIPPPSPITNPSRSVSNGRLAVVAIVTRRHCLIVQNPAIPVGVIDASDPPVAITFASPRWIAWNASPIAFVAEAHAVTTVVFGPLAPSCIDT